MNNDDPNIIFSPLSCVVSRDGLTVNVHIYRLETEDSWTLELIDEEWSSTIWDDKFPSDTAAYAEFEQGLAELGLILLLQGEDDPTIH
ncbi:hypothetical protein [Ochrobactrum sp. MYb379]|uniref:hypothetical protein n=1 Tax=Ochrobactrum sp. MYb379 TaxID=2745275 RepID=UPI0030AB5E1D